jgi:RNA polymerase sigma factor (sigma-70 family)
MTHWRLVLQHQEVARRLARRWVRRNPGLRGHEDDLVQEGILGLHEAARRFQPERGHQFSTYGWYWAQHRVRRAAMRLLQGRPASGATLLPAAHAAAGSGFGSEDAPGALPGLHPEASHDTLERDTEGAQLVAEAREALIAARLRQSARVQAQLDFLWDDSAQGALAVRRARAARDVDLWMAWRLHGEEAEAAGRAFGLKRDTSRSIREAVEALFQQWLAQKRPRQKS